MGSLDNVGASAIARWTTQVGRLTTAASIPTLRVPLWSPPAQGASG
jgi:hypothetical protein